MKFKFKPTLGNISAFAAIVLAILGLVFGSISNSRGVSVASTYAVDGMGMMIAFSVIAMVAALAAVAMDCLFEGKLFSIIADVLLFAAAGFLIAAFSVMVSSRGWLMGDVWFSDQASGNATAVSAMNMAVVSWVFYILSVVAAGVALYGGLCKKSKKSVSESAAQKEAEI